MNIHKNAGLTLIDAQASIMSRRPRSDRWTAAFRHSRPSQDRGQEHRRDVALQEAVAVLREGRMVPDR